MGETTWKQQRLIVAHDPQAAARRTQARHLIKIDLKADAFSFTIDDSRQRYLEQLDGKLLLVTNTDARPAEVVQRYKSLADIERGFRVPTAKHCTG